MCAHFSIAAEDPEQFGGYLPTVAYQDFYKMGGGGWGVMPVSGAMHLTFTTKSGGGMSQCITVFSKNKISPKPTALLRCIGLYDYRCRFQYISLLMPRCGSKGKHNRRPLTASFILAMGDYLFRIGRLPSPMCPECNTAEHTIPHLFSCTAHPTDPCPADLPAAYRPIVRTKRHIYNYM